MYKSTRQLFLTVLIMLTLLGTQAIKESPFHDHSQDEFDCVLCHSELNDDSVVSGSDALVISSIRSVYHTTAKQFKVSQRFSPFNSRAPPHFFL